MAKRLKRAFTIVELVIVIAVIAILAAVLIPTFTTLIDKANESNDIALVKNLNTALVSKEATDEVNTMQDALDAAYEYGYTVDKLTPSSSGDIVWDEVNNRFALINEKKEVVFEDGAKPLTNDATKTWKIVTELKGTQDCSWYVGGLSKKAIEDFKFTMGVDTGSVEANVNYASDSTQNVTIHTAGGALTVNAKNATVSHHGTAQSVDVQAVAGNSYHEYGKIEGAIEIASGRVEMMNGSAATAIVITASKENAAAVKIAINTNSQVKKISATSTGILEKAEISDTTNSVDKVVADLAGSVEYESGLGTAENPYVIANVEQWINFANGSDASAQKYWKVTQNLDFTNSQDYCVRFKGVIDFCNTKVSGVQIHDERFGCLFHDVYNGSTIKNLTYESSGRANLIYAVQLNGEGNVVLSNITTEGLFHVGDNNTTPYVWAVLGKQEAYNAGATLEYIDCVNKTDITSTANNSAAVFLGKIYEYEGYYAAKVSFKNCKNYGTLIHATATESAYASMLIANGCTFSHGKLEDITVENCINYGTIIGPNKNGNSNLLCGSGWSGSVSIEEIKEWCQENAANLKNAGEGSCTDKSFTQLQTDSTGNIDLSAVTEASSYKISFGMWFDKYSDATKVEHTEWGSLGISIDVDSVAGLEINAVKWIGESEIPEDAQMGTVVIGNTTIVTCTTEGETYYVLQKEDVSSAENEYLCASNSSMIIFAYDETGEITEIYVYAF